MAASPQFTGTPLYGSAVVSTANTNRDGSGTLATVLTLPAGGGRIDRAVLKATGNTTAGMLRLFIHDGTAARCIAEIPVPAITVSATVASFETVIDFATGESAAYGLVLPAGHSLRACTHVAETFHVTAFGGQF